MGDDDQDFLVIPSDFILGDMEEEPTAPAVPDAVTISDIVLKQYQNLPEKSRTWAIALCKTSGGLAFLDRDSDAIWLFRDESTLWMQDSGALRRGGRISEEDIHEDRFRRTWL